MVFCHEWIQIVNGSMDYIRLKDDLSETVGEPRTLFYAVEAPWSRMDKVRGNEMQDTGETLKIVQEFRGLTPLQAKDVTKSTA
jgi:hypothetical protein